MQIKLMLLGLAAFSLNASAQYAGDFVLGNRVLTENQMRIGAVQKQVLRNTNGQPPHNPLRLAKAFVESASKHGLDPVLLSAMASVESGYFVGAINSRTADYGILQVNAYNIKALGLSKKRLLTDIEYSVEAGATILAYFKKRYAVKEPGTWFCRYNIGTRKKSGALLRICDRYVAKVNAAR